MIQQDLKTKCVVLFIIILLFILAACGSMSIGPANTISSISLSDNNKCKYLYHVIDNSDHITWAEITDSCGKHRVGDTIVIQHK